MTAWIREIESKKKWNVIYMTNDSVVTPFQ